MSQHDRGGNDTNRVDTISVDQVELPCTYEHDLRNVVSLIDWLGRHDPEGDLTIESGSVLVLGNKNDYLIGRLIFEEDQWKFEPYADWAQS